MSKGLISVLIYKNDFIFCSYVLHSQITLRHFIVNLYYDKSTFKPFS